MTTFHGAWPALVTPYQDDGSVNTAVLRDIIEYHIDKGVSGFYTGGSTGEGHFLPIKLRKLISETVLQQVDGRVPVIVHAGSISLQDAIEMAIHAEKHGAAGISSILPPFYETTEVIFKYFEALAGATPDLPFLPYLLNPKVDTITLLRRTMEIPNLAGSKYTGSNMFEFRQLIELGNSKWTMFSGMDEQCVYAAMAGASGNIGSTVNFMPGAYIAIHQYIAEGKYAEAHNLQQKANAVTAIMIECGFMGALKAVMKHLGFDCGQPYLPHLPMNADEEKMLFQKLEQTNFVELTKM